MASGKEPKKFWNVGQAAEEVERQKHQKAKLEDALIKIAAGDGYYGAQAREYKNIARVALGQPLL